jgi:hypothetical protein
MTCFSPHWSLDICSTRTTASCGVLPTLCGCNKYAYTTEREFLWLRSEKRILVPLLSYPNRFMIMVHPRYTHIYHAAWGAGGGGHDGVCKVPRNLRS